MTHPNATRRRIIAALAGSGLTAPWLGSCTLEHTLRLSFHPWSGYEPLRTFCDAAPGMAAFLQLVEVPDAASQFDLLRLERVEAALLPFDEVILGQIQALELCVLCVVDVSSGGDQILSRGRCDERDSLPGARIAVEHHGPGLVLFHAWCEHIGLDPATLNRVPLSPERQIEAWRNGAIDLAVSYQPHAEKLRRMGATPCFDTSRLPPLIVDVLVARNAILVSHAGALKRLVQLHFLALEWMRQHPNDARYRLAARFGLPPDEAFLPLVGLIFPALREQGRWMTRELPAVTRRLVPLLTRAGAYVAHTEPDIPVRLDFLPRPSA